MPTSNAMSSGIWRWADFWEFVPPPQARFTFGEGGTALVRSHRIGPAAGLRQLWFKLESGNPTGSYKDRFAAAAVSWMLAEAVTDCLATSSGNSGAALAAACAAAAIRCRIAVVETAPVGKLRQMLAYGAQLDRVRGFGHDPQVTARTFDQVRQLGSRARSMFQVSAYGISPRSMAGVESIAFELGQQLDLAGAQVFAPAGGGGLCLALVRGLARLAVDASVHCVQPVGNDTIAGPLRRGATGGVAIDQSRTRISGLQVPDLLDAEAVIAGCRACGGTGQLVEDDAVWQAQQRLAQEEGIFAEPAGATALAGALQAAASAEIDPEKPLVCLVTGSGFKDQEALQRITDLGRVRLVDRFAD